MTPNRFRACGLPRGPNVGIRLFGCVPVASRSFSKSTVALDVGAQGRFAGVYIAGEHDVDALAQKHRRKIPISRTWAAPIPGCFSSMPWLSSYPIRGRCRLHSVQIAFAASKSGCCRVLVPPISKITSTSPSTRDKTLSRLNGQPRLYPLCGSSPCRRFA
jgi:hypothetical protein